MKFNFDRDTLLQKVSQAQKVIVLKNYSNNLSNVFLSTKDSTLTIKATDGVMSYRSEIPVEVEEEGEVALFCDRLFAILQTTPSGDVQFTGTDSEVVIKPTKKDVKFKMRNFSSDKFQDAPIPDDLQFFQFTPLMFEGMVKQTVYAVSDNVDRIFMTGVLFEKDGDKFKMVATDARRLAYSERDLKDYADFTTVNFPNVIVPPKILYSMLDFVGKNDFVQIAITEKSVYIKVSGCFLQSSLIDGEFPTYEKVIPKETKHFFEVAKEDLELALKRVGTMFEKESKKVIFELSKDNLFIHSPNGELGSVDENVPCKYDDENMTIAINASYLLDTMKNITGEVRVEFNDPMSALIVKDTKNNFHFDVIMPMHL